MIDSPDTPIHAELHCHTNRSDGVLAPSELVMRAREAGLNRIVITDHDTSDGYRAIRDSVFEGISVYSGIEISSAAGSYDAHVLGYFVDPDDHALMAVCAETVERRAERTLVMMERLVNDGYPCAPENLREQGYEVVNRSNVARLLVNHGDASTVSDAFSRFLSSSSPYYEPIRNIDVRDAIDIIKGAGGTPVLAHPYYYGLVGQIPRLVRYGLQGIEAYHSEQSAFESAYLDRMGHELGILVTGGSDFHGDNVHRAVIGGCQPAQEDMVRLFERAEGR